MSGWLICTAEQCSSMVQVCISWCCTGTPPSSKVGVDTGPSGNVNCRRRMSPVTPTSHTQPSSLLPCSAGSARMMTGALASRVALGGCPSGMRAPRLALRLQVGLSLLPPGSSNRQSHTSASHALGAACCVDVSCKAKRLCTAMALQPALAVLCTAVSEWTLRLHSCCLQVRGGALLRSPAAPAATRSLHGWEMTLAPRSHPRQQLAA